MFVLGKYEINKGWYGAITLARMSFRLFSVYESGVIFFNWPNVLLTMFSPMYHRMLSVCFPNVFSMVSECFQNGFRMFSVWFQNVFRMVSECFQYGFRMLSE